MKLTEQGIYNLINTVETESIEIDYLDTSHYIDTKNKSIILKICVMENSYYDIYVKHELIFRPNKDYVTLYTTYSYSPIEPDEHTDETYTIEETIVFLKNLIRGF